MRQVLAILLVACVYAIPVLAQPRGPSESGIDKVSEFQDAAINYESAASTQESIGNALLRNVISDPQSDEDRPTRNKRLGRNASLKMQGTGQYTGAAENWDRAAKAWKSAAAAVQEASARAYFQQAALKCTNQATSLIQRAAELTEAAALAYSDAGDLRGHISASQKAGQIRMQLAGRQ